MPLSDVRSLLSRRVGKVIDRWVAARIPYDRLDDVSRALVGLQDQVDDLRGRLDHERGRLDDLIARVNGFHDRAEWTASQVERVLPQVAAQETEIQGLRARLEAAPLPESPEEVAQARTLIEEIRAEHARIRVRLTGVAQYEERLGRLEERLRAG